MTAQRVLRKEAFLLMLASDLVWSLACVSPSVLLLL